MWHRPYPAHCKLFFNVLGIWYVSPSRKTCLIQDYLAAKEGLRSVDIAGAEGVGDGGIVALATQCRHLQTLNMSGARRVTDVAIRECHP